MPNPIANAMLALVLNSPLHALLGNSFAVISLSGRKTGRKISTPVNVAPEDGGYTVVSYRNRTWWRNLLGGRPGTLRVAGKNIAVTARIDDQPAAVRSGLQKYFERHPGYAKYFEVQSDGAGGFRSEDLDRVSADRVIIHLIPGTKA
jgi:deazaflavin-dependent oxidoreductase (nitroreductase family)